jgi:hypothetical protein
MEIKDNIVFFESDDEFTDFCVAPFAKVKTDENGSSYYEGDYSDMYKEYLQQGLIFMIKDENSVVCKRQCVCTRVPLIMEGEGRVRSRRDVPIQLPVENLEMYFSDLYE